jgi:hypothetical protein
MHGSRGHSVAAEELSHEVSVGNGDAERESAAATLLAPDIKRMLGTFLCLDSLRERGRIEPSATPRYWRIVDVICDAEVMERAEVTAFDALGERALVNQVVRAQRQQVSAVHAIGSRGKPKHESRLEMLDHSPIAAGGGVVKLIDDDVVESIGLKLIQVRGKGLNTGEQDAGTRLLRPAVVQTKIRIWLHPAKHLKGLPQDLLAMGHKQHTPELRPGSVKRREPCFAQPSRHHDQATTKSLQPRLLQNGQCVPLHRSRSRWRSRRLRHHTRGMRGWLPPLPIVRQQLVGERPTAGIGPEPFERGN